MTITNLSTMTNGQLADVYNGLIAAQGGKPIKGWKGKKEVLIDKIKTLSLAQDFADVSKTAAEANGASASEVEQVTKVEPVEEIGTIPPVETKEERIARGRAAREANRAKIGLVVDNTKPEEPKPAKKAKKPKPEKKARKVGEEDPNSVRRRALELLAEVAYYEDKTKESGPDNVIKIEDVKEPGKNLRSVGLSYYDILSTIGSEWKAKQRPSPATSDACLRWYTVKVHASEHGFAGWKLAQRRPRSLGGKGKKVIKDYVVVCQSS